MAIEIDRNGKQAVYKQIYQILLAEINDGVYDDAAVLPSEKELCNRFLVERNTLRNALRILVDEGVIYKRPGYGTMLANNGSTFEKVKPADSPADNVRKNILLVTQEDYLQDNGEYFHFRLINRIDRSISEMGYNLIFKSVGINGDFKDIIKHTMPAAIIYDSYVHAGLYRDGLDAGVPCISINHYTPLMTSVVSNNYDGAYSVAKTLYESGHRRIAVITGKRNYQTNIERMSGLQTYYLKKGLPLSKILVIEGDWLFTSGVSAGEQIISMNESERPTAVFALNDDMAFGCYSSIERAGIRVPGDISIVGFDKSDRYSSIFPMITTVDVNVDAMIEHTCWILSGYLDGTAPGFSVKLQIDTTFIDNGTILTIPDD